MVPEQTTLPCPALRCPALAAGESELERVELWTQIDLGSRARAQSEVDQGETGRRGAGRTGKLL